MRIAAATLAAALLAIAGTAAAAGEDKDAVRSLEARKTCDKLGHSGDRKKLEACCRNNVPTQARQADWDRYTAICMKGEVAKQAPKK